VRKGFDKKEIHYLESILQDGQDKGVFRIGNVRKTAEIVHYAFKGLEVPVIRGVLGLDYNKKGGQGCCLEPYLQGVIPLS